jgi:hypothetical protein
MEGRRRTKERFPLPAAHGHDFTRTLLLVERTKPKAGLAVLLFEVSCSVTVYVSRAAPAASNQQQQQQQHHKNKKNKKPSAGATSGVPSNELKSATNFPEMDPSSHPARDSLMLCCSVA